MNVTKKHINLWFPVFIIIVIMSSYYYNFTYSEGSLHYSINETFKHDALLWGEIITRDKGIPFRSRYNSEEYAKKKTTTLLTAEDTIVISSLFYHPDIYLEYQRKNGETSLLLDDDFDVNLADSLFKATIANLGIIAESSVELKVRDLHQMFPTADSMNADVPFVKAFTSGPLEGYITEPVGVGICNHALLYGHVKIPFSTILLNMEWFGVPQIVAIILFVFLYFTFSFVIPRFLFYLKFRKSVVFLGNTCIDLSRKELYLWSGECRHITDIRMALIKMIIDAAPSYKLSKEMVCRDIWNLDTKDAQARYDMAMKGMRTLFITEDVSLELKSLTGEGVQLLINDSLIKKGRKFHFLWIYLRNESKSNLI